MTLMDPYLLARTLEVTERNDQLSFGPDTFLSCENIEQAAMRRALVCQLTPLARTAMESSRAALHRLAAENTPIYGTTTGFGPFVIFPSADGGLGEACHGSGLLSHLGAGWGPREHPWTPDAVVRATMLIRGQNLAQGHSAISPLLLEQYLRFVERDITPRVPIIGSVGASGDLIPLSHIARAIAGEPDAMVSYRDREQSAVEAMRDAELSPIQLGGREALALTNGTSYLTAYATMSVARAERLLLRAERITGWIYRLLGARSPALSDPLHRARGHEGQIQSARNIRAEAIKFGEWERTDRPLQEVYSLRCAPQILGACRENLAFARKIVETEINGVTDNPLFFAESMEDDTPEVLHGGNFHGQQVAFAADALNAALTQAAVLAERQIDLLVTPSTFNESAPLLLAFEPGSTSGMAGAQITATALVAEMRSSAQAHATMSIPTNGRNQDVVSMGALAARRCYEQTERFAAVLALLSLCAAQLTFLRTTGKANGPVTPLPEWITPFDGLKQDRALRQEIATLTETFCQPT